MRKNMKVAIFGLGVWGRLYWLGPLLQMAEEGVISLQLVDLPDQAPNWYREVADGDIEIHVRDLVLRESPKLPDLAFRIPKERVHYVSAAGHEALKDLETAIVVTGARVHHETIQGILENCAELRHLICEKPCGDSMAEFSEIQSLCEAANVQLVVSDHYLLRPSVREWLSDRDHQTTLSDASSIHAFMLEETSDGPPDQDANLDMLVHPLNLLHTLFPGSEFDVEKTCMGQGARDPHASITYCQVRGKLSLMRGAIPCHIEVGKQLLNQKEIVIETATGSILIDLRKGAPWAQGVWAYRGLIDAVITSGLRGDDLRGYGGIPSSSMRMVWDELESIRSIAPATKTYLPGHRPNCE